MRMLSYLVLLVVLLSGCGHRIPNVPKTAEISAKSGSSAPAAEEAALGDDDWPSWRGPNCDGVAVGEPVPVEWSDTKNVVWKVKIPGRGHSSPIIVGERIYFETADEGAQTQSVVCLERKDGSQVWQKELHKGKFERNMHGENTQASSTLACDGKRLYALFLNDQKIWATALELDGNQVWQKEVGNFASKFGYSASPTIYKSLLILAADHAGGGFIAALSRDKGDIVWRKSRPAKSSYASPRVVSLGGRDQVVLCGCNQIAGFDPANGESLWSADGTAEAAVGTPVVSGDLVCGSGGFPEQDTLAVGSDGKAAWHKPVKSYVPSVLAHGGLVYLIDDGGVARCLDAATGDKKWEKRIGGNFRVSPVLSGDAIFITDMKGKTTVFKASGEKYELLAENQLGDEAFASPAVSRGQLFLRVAESSGRNRQEWLYCIGKQ